jgi:hypothetical protein
MATEKQIAANRANAKRSTGPKTAAGKLKSSRNAVRHGLSCPLPLDSARSEQADAISRILAGEGADDEQLRSMTEVAHAQLELLRIRKIRSELMAAIDFACGDPRPLRRLMSLDRYERYASTKRFATAYLGISSLGILSL